MATTVGQHGVAAFTNPSNGDALDATVVKANDNTLRDAYVGHDSDPGIHIQSSVLAARPAAGTVGRKWMTTDTGNVKLWYDNGSTWENLDYLPTAGDVTITGNLDVVGSTSFLGSVDLPSGTILTSPSLLGTMSGGTVAPTTLTIPSGTTIPTHTETGTITAGGSTRNGGTLSGATLSGTTTNSGTISGGTIDAASLSGTITNGGTISGGTVAPSTLTIPSGTTIPTHTETGTITATGSTRNGGTISGATLSNPTFSGTITGLSITSISTALSTTALGTSDTTLTSQGLSSSATYLITASGQVNITPSSSTAAFCMVTLTLSSASGNSIAQQVGIQGGSYASGGGTVLYFPFSFQVVWTNPGTVTLAALRTTNCTANVTNQSWFSAVKLT